MWMLAVAHSVWCLQLDLSNLAATSPVCMWLTHVLRVVSSPAKQGVSTPRRRKKCRQVSLKWQSCSHSTKTDWPSLPGWKNKSQFCSAPQWGQMSPLAAESASAGTSGFWHLSSCQLLQLLAEAGGCPIAGRASCDCCRWGGRCCAGSGCQRVLPWQQQPPPAPPGQWRHWWLPLGCLSLAHWRFWDSKYQTRDVMPSININLTADSSHSTLAGTI